MVLTSLVDTFEPGTIRMRFLESCCETCIFT